MEALPICGIVIYVLLWENFSASAVFREKAAASTLRLLAAVVKLTVLVFWISAVVQLALLAVELLSGI